MGLKTCDRHTSTHYVVGCADCRQRATRYRNRRKQGIRDGTWHPMVTGDELDQVRRHCLRLREAGFGSGAMSAASGVARSSINQLMDPGRAQQAMLPENARALLTVNEQDLLRRVDGRQLLVPVERTRWRLQMLAVNGWGAQRISDLIGSHPDTINRWHSSGQRSIARHWERAIAELYDKIVGLPRGDRWGGSERTRSRVIVDSCGATRRLQALAVDGWTVDKLAPLCGCTSAQLRQWRDEVQPVTGAQHAAITRLYEQIQQRPNPWGGSRRQAVAARRLRWLPPERWDDDEIDDPQALPLPAAEDLDMLSDEHVAAQVASLLGHRHPVVWRQAPHRVQVVAARRLHDAGEATYRDLSELTGLTIPQMRHAIRGKPGYQRESTKQREGS